MSTKMTAAPGWYGDPFTGRGVRWFNGTSWTGFTAAPRRANNNTMWAVLAVVSVFLIPAFVGLPMLIGVAVGWACDSNR